WAGMERFTASWFENQLLQQWIPAMPDVEEKLQRGVRVADVGCGSGRALIRLAGAFPESEFVGNDAFEGQLERARANAESAGVAGWSLPSQYSTAGRSQVAETGKTRKRAGAGGRAAGRGRRSPRPGRRCWAKRETAQPSLPASNASLLQVGRIANWRPARVM